MAKNKIPKHIIEKANTATSNLFPEKSKDRYINIYKLFTEWKEEQKISSTITETNGEPIFLTYFSELADKYAPSSLWTFYSMLKSAVLNNDNVDIGKFSKLQMIYLASLQEIIYIKKLK